MIEFLMFGGTAACGATVALLLSSFFNGNAQARGTWCVVRIHKRPALYEILYESRSPATSRRYAHGQKDVMVLNRSDVDIFNAKQVAKPAFFIDLRSLIQAYVELVDIKNSRDYADETPVVAPDAVAALEKKMDERFKNTAEILFREIRALDDRVMQATGEIPTYRTREIEPGSVMPEMAPTEAMVVPVDAATNPFGVPTTPLRQPSHRKFQPEKHPTRAGGIPKVVTPENTRTVIIPLSDPPPPKGGH